MKLTNKQKIEILEIAISLFEDGVCKFICDAVHVAANQKGIKISFDETFVFIPELLPYKPDNPYDAKSWFSIDEIQKRIDICKDTIYVLKALKICPKCKSSENYSFDFNAGKWICYDCDEMPLT